MRKMGHWIASGQLANSLSLTNYDFTAANLLAQLAADSVSVLEAWTRPAEVVLGGHVSALVLPSAAIESASDATFLPLVTDKPTKNGQANKLRAEDGRLLLLASVFEHSPYSNLPLGPWIGAVVDVGPVER
jgi:hypothetical protein